MRIVFFISFLLFTKINEYKHEFYFSLTEIEYVKEKKSVQIISKVFTDDLETMLRKRVNENIVLDLGKDETGINEYILNYYRDKFIVTINNEPKEYVFIGKEYEEDTVFIYFEIEDIPVLETMEVTNKVLFDTFNEQQNIIKIKHNKEIKNYILIPEKTSQFLNF